MTDIRRLAIVALLAVSGAACAKAQARTPAPAPELTVPAPPSRIVIPVTVRVPEPTPTEPVTAEPARPPATTGAPPARSPERLPTTTTPPATTSAPPPVLQTTANPAALEERVRGMVAAARADLAKVDRTKLTENARDQFDTAQRFIRMAEDALNAKNLVYAQQLAESAAALAGRLVKGEPAAATAP